MSGGGGWIRTTEAFASDLQSDPFDRSGTPPKSTQLTKLNKLRPDHVKWYSLKYNVEPAIRFELTTG